MTYCDCGRRKARDARECRACAKQRIQACIDAVRAIVAAGKCPDCGTGLVRNSGIAGWWQCGAYATESFRQPQYRGLPPCHWQGFTE